MHVLVVFGNGGGLIGRSQLPTLSFTTFPVAYTKSVIISFSRLDLRDIIIQTLAAFVCYPDSLAAMENMPEAL